MAGFDNPFGTGSGNAPAYQRYSQSTRTRNQQQQAQYGTASAGAAGGSPAATPAPVPTGSPVTPTGQIAPTFSGANAGQDALTWALNNAPMSPTVMNQMKGALRDQAGLMMQQGMTDIAQNAASRGLSGGGWQGEREGALREGTIGNLLGGYRDIDINAATTNRQSLLAALGIDSQNFGTRANMLGTMMNRQSNMDQTGLGYAQLAAAQQQALWRALGLG